MENIFGRFQILCWTKFVVLILSRKMRGFGMGAVAEHCLRERQDAKGAFSHPAFAHRKFWVFLLAS